VASLLEQQRAFAAAISDRSRAPEARVAVRPAANLDVYRNNSDWQFRNALALSFPVVKRRVGDEYFRQLATHYRRQYPSRSGDLHWVGRDFPTFLAAHLAAGDYAWLADLAALEWACELSSVKQSLPPLAAEALAAVPPEDLEGLGFALQPSLQLGGSSFPVVSVWVSNQRENAPPVDQSLGAEYYTVLSWDGGPEVTRLSPSLSTFLSALKDGTSLGAAMTRAGLDEAGLLTALQFLFAQRLVCALHSAKR
jgi:hypothetical protein